MNYSEIRNYNLNDVRSTSKKDAHDQLTSKHFALAILGTGFRDTVRDDRARRSLPNYLQSAAC